MVICAAKLKAMVVPSNIIVKLKLQASNPDANCGVVEVFYCEGCIRIEALAKMTLS